MATVDSGSSVFRQSLGIKVEAVAKYDRLRIEAMELKAAEDGRADYEEMLLKSMRDNRDVAEVMQAMEDESSDSEGKLSAGGGPTIDDSISEPARYLG